MLRCSPIATVGMSGRAHCGATGIGHGAQLGRPRTTSMTFGTSPEPCFPASGASLAEIKKRGRWKSDAMVLRYQHATEDRDALLARATAPFVPIPEPSPLCSAPTPRPNSLPTPAFTPDDAVTSANDEESSGGETRTLNLAGPPEQDQYQHPLE